MNDIRLVCFDLDDTLITHNSWHRMNIELGVTREQDKYLFDEYSAGRITYDEWNARLVELYMQHPGATRERIAHILTEYTYMPHAREAVSDLQKKGYEIALISGSIDMVAAHVAHDLGIKYFKANNTIVFDDNDRIMAIHSGGADTIAKLRYLEAFAEMLNVPLDECACVGDGANDIELFRATGKGITFKGSPIENEAWKVIEDLKGLEAIFD